MGGYTIDGASTLDELEAQVERDGVLATLPLADAARATFPARDLTPEERTALSYGKWVDPSAQDATTAAIGDDGSLVALLENVVREGKHKAKPVIVFAPA